MSSTEDRSDRGDRRRGDHITTTDLQSPLFIHPSDNSGMVITSIVLTGENYRRWRRAVTKALSVKNKTGFVEGTISQTPENALQWNRCNDMVCGWILNTVSKEIYATLHEFDFAKEMWDDLEESYGQTNGPLIFQIKKQIQDCEQGDILSISDYFTRLKGHWQQLSGLVTQVRCKCGKCECNLNVLIENQEQENKLMTFLMGLNEKYAPARRQFLFTTPLPTTSAAHALLIQDESSRKSDSEAKNMATGTTLMAKAPAGDDRSKKEKCIHCEGYHKSEKCWEKFGYPSWHTKGKNKPQPSKDKPRYKANSATSNGQDGQTMTDMFMNLSGDNQKMMQSFLQMLGRNNHSGDKVAEVNLAGQFKEEVDCSW